MAHLVLRQDWIWRADKRIDLQVKETWQVAKILDVVGCQDQRDAGQRAGLAGVDGEFRMRMRRAEHQRVQRRLRSDVVGIAALAADERIVFLAADALANAELDGSSHLFSDCSADSGEHIAAVRRPAQTGFRMTASTGSCNAIS